MLKIGLVIPHFPSQTHTFFWREICALERIGAEVVVFTTSRPPDAELCHDWTAEAMARTIRLDEGVVSTVSGALRSLVRHPIRCLRGLWSLMSADWRSPKERLRAFFGFCLGLRLATDARRLGVVHVHAHSAAMASVVARIAASVSDLHCSMTLHGPLIHYGGGQQWKWGGMDFVVIVAKQLLETIPEAYRALPVGGVHVSSMGVDLGRFDGRRRGPGHGSAEAFRLVSCGRLHVAKGHQDVIRAVGILRERGRRVALRILGAGPHRSDLESLVHELGLAEQVDLAGACGELEVRDELGRSDAFVLGSHDEAIGVATMEAMAMRLPVVVTDVGGVGELVDESVGRLVPPASPECIADAVEGLVADPDLGRKLGDAGRRRIEEAHGSERAAGFLLSLIGGGVSGRDVFVTGAQS